MVALALWDYLITQKRILDPYTITQPAVTTVGCTGMTTYSYQVVAHTAAGTGGYNGSPPVAGIGSTTNGNATLSGTNYNTLAWPALPGATSYDVLRWTGSAWALCNGGSGVTGTTFNDQSITTTAYTMPGGPWDGYTIVGAGPDLTYITFARPNGGSPAADEYLFYNYNLAKYVNIWGITFQGTGFEQYLFNYDSVGWVQSVRHWNCYFFNFWRCITNDGINSLTSEMLHVGCKCLGIGTLSTGLDNTGWFYKIQNNKQSVNHYFIGCDLVTYGGTIFLINAGGNLHVAQFSVGVFNNSTFLTISDPTATLIGLNNHLFNFRDGRIELHQNALLANLNAWCRVQFDGTLFVSRETPPAAGRIQVLDCGEIDFNNCYVQATVTAVLTSHTNTQYSVDRRPTLRFEKCGLEYQLYDGVQIVPASGSDANCIGGLGHAIAKNCRNAIGVNQNSPVDVHLGRLNGYHSLADGPNTHFWTYNPNQNSGLVMGGAQITTLSAAASQGASSFTVANGASMPTSGFVTIAGDGTNAKENVAISSVVGNTVNILGTVSHNHTANSTVASYQATGNVFIPAGAFVKRIGIYWPGTGPSSNFQVQVLDSASNVLCDSGSRAGTNAGTVWTDCGVNVSNNTKKQFNITGIATGGQWIVTTLSAAASAGATSFTVASAAGLGAGMVIAIYGDGTNPGENITVGSVSGNTVTLAGGATLQSAHNFGASVAATAIPGGVFFEYY